MSAKEPAGAAIVTTISVERSARASARVMLPPWMRSSG
jgi:hypothetical protein